MHKDDLKAPGAINTIVAFYINASAIQVSLHRTGSVEVTLSRATEDAKSSNHFLPENKTNSKDPAAILPTSSPSPPMATENQLLMAAISESRAEIKRLTLDRAKLIEGLDRASTHILRNSAKKKDRKMADGGEADQDGVAATLTFSSPPRSDAASADGGPRNGVVGSVTKSISVQTLTTLELPIMKSFQFN